MRARLGCREGMLLHAGSYVVGRALLEARCLLVQTSQVGLVGLRWRVKPTKDLWLLDRSGLLLLVQLFVSPLVGQLYLLAVVSRQPAQRLLSIHLLWKPELPVLGVDHCQVVHRSNHLLEACLDVEHLHLLRLRHGDFLVEVAGDERVLQGSLGIVSLDLVDATQFADQVLGHRTHVVRIVPELGLNCCDLLLQSMAIIRQNSASYIERVVAEKHIVEREAHGVYINLLVVALARDLLWRHVKYRSDLLLVSFLETYSVGGREAEVDNF